MRKPPQEKIKRGNGAPPKAAFTGKRPVLFDGRFRPRRPTGAPSCSPATGSAGRR